MSNFIEMELKSGAHKFSPKAGNRLVKGGRFRTKATPKEKVLTGDVFNATEEEAEGLFKNRATRYFSTATEETKRPNSAASKADMITYLEAKGQVDGEDFDSGDSKADLYEIVKEV